LKNRIKSRAKKFEIPSLTHEEGQKYVIPPLTPEWGQKYEIPSLTPGGVQKYEKVQTTYIEDVKPLQQYQSVANSGQSLLFLKKIFLRIFTTKRRNLFKKNYSISTNHIYVPRILMSVASSHHV
jgi:hypothetical protein